MPKEKYLSLTVRLTDYLLVALNSKTYVDVERGQY